MIGDTSTVVLAGHGIIVTGSDLSEATYRAASIERVCRLAYDVMLTGRQPLTMDPGLMKAMKSSLLDRGAYVYWAGCRAPVAA